MDAPPVTASDVPKWKCQQLATLWLAAGEAPEWIARQLGHTSTEMLFRVYSRFIPNLTRQDGSAMDRLLTHHISMNATPNFLLSIKRPHRPQDQIPQMQNLRTEK